MRASSAHPSEGLTPERHRPTRWCGVTNSTLEENMTLYRYVNDDIHEPLYLATPEDIIEAFNGLPLPVRMRAWLETSAREADRRSGAGGSLAVQCYPAYAYKWDREDAEKAKQDNDIEELARLLHKSDGSRVTWDTATERARGLYRINARAVIDAGWRKGGDDD